MCGIAGFIGEDRQKIDRMVHAVKLRGPDHQASWVGHGASIGNARLAIIDPRPEGNQPIFNDDKTIVLTFNGEIYNYKQLKEEEHLQCRTGTDTEVVLRLYEKYGMNFISRLRGMFAFAIYDTRKRTLHIARDESGILPLFVSTIDGKLHFASTLRALLIAYSRKPALRMEALSQYMRLQYVPGPQTMCEGIEQLPPGAVLSSHRGKQIRHSFIAKTEKLHFSSPHDFQERFPALMDYAVLAHMVADKPIGIFLSGGMDSSIVLHHMCQHSRKPVKTFTVRFETTDEEGRERFNTDADLAAITAKHYGTEHHELHLTAAQYKDAYAAATTALDQPNADPVSVAQFLLATMAKKHVDVVLNGAGGDELFGGYPRYRIARVLHALRMIPSGMRSVLGSLRGYPHDVLAMDPGPALAERLLARPTDEIQPIIHGDWFNPDATTQLFHSRFSNTESRIPNPVRAFMEFDRHTWLPDESLRLADGTTLSGNGLECRVPFLDPTIINASHASKAQWHTTLTTTKALLKKTYRSILPDHLFTLPKASFYPPLAKWLRRECRPLFEHAIENPRIREYFNVEILRTIEKDHREHRKYALHTLSSVMQLAYWFEEVYDR